MFTKIHAGLLMLAVTFAILLTSAQAACLGVSRTININTFKSSMGASPSAGIGLRHKEVVLTFDDGPVPGRTTSILSSLSAECTRATFFVVGNMARAYPSLLRRVARAGHTIAHHTQSHSHLPGSPSGHARAQVINGVAMVNKALGPLRNRSSRLFRYPYLARNASLDRLLRQQRLLPFSANIDSTDWKPISSQAVVNRVMSQLQSRGRGVILLHDIQPRTVAALPVLLDRLKAGGYKIVHVRAGNVATPALVSTGPSKKIRKKVAALRSVDRTATGSIKRDRRTVDKKKRKTLFGSWFKTRKKTADKAPKTKTKKVASVRKKPKKSLTWLERRRAESLARSKAKKSAPKRKAKKTETKKKKRFSLFSRKIKRKPGESVHSYHHRLKRAQAKAKR